MFFVSRLIVNWLVIKLEVTGEGDGAGRGSDNYTEGIGDRMINVKGLNGELA